MEDQSMAALCRMGCGFFGSAVTEGMCSKCFRDYQRRKNAQHDQQPANAESQELRQSSQACAVGPEVHATPLSELTVTSQPETSPKTPKKNRCFVCRKKVGLTGFECRCGSLFCGLHRYADKHNCTFDYKAAGREELERKHPKVVAAKIQKL